MPDELDNLRSIPLCGADTDEWMDTAIRWGVAEIEHLRKRTQTMNEGMIPIDIDMITDAAKPRHYREAAASLRGIADADGHGHGTHGPSFVDGLRFGARLLERTARDLEEEGQA